MASSVARRAVAGFQPAVTSCQASRCAHRSLHSTPSVQKKKSNVVIDELFSDDGPVEDLIKSEATTSSTVLTTGVAGTSATRSSRKRKLTPELRHKRYQQIWDFVTPRIGKHPKEKLPKVRNSAWIHMVGLATTEEQLTQIAELFSRWIEGGRVFDDAFSELFVRRCEELKCPDLALKVFGHYGKYNLKLTLPGARQLLHSLHQSHPIEKVMTASSLFSIYSLSPVAEDLISCSMMASACYRHNTKASLDVAQALLPSIQKLLERTKPMKQEGALEKSQKWLKWSLKKVEEGVVEKTKTQADWLTVWRAGSGHIASAS